MDKSTKIIATISDKRCDREFIRQLFERGMNVVRLNSAHLDRDGITRIVTNVRAVSERIAIMLDTKGPEIRTTANITPDVKISFKAGQNVTFAGEPEEATTPERICLTYKDIANELRRWQHILIDDGELDFLIDSVDKDSGVIYARAQNDGQLGSRKSVNIPGAEINLPAVTPRDRRMIEIAAELGIDFVAHSFVRSADDVHQVHKVLDEAKSEMKIISKIENQQGVDNIDEIINSSYGIMIARGDLGIEVAAEKIPVIQAGIIKKCIRNHRPVIVATQMLHTMIVNPRPTRAEVSDIANAVYQRVDALMLSGETANGRYPLEAVDTMARVAMEVEHTLSTGNTDVPPLADAHVTSFLARQAVVSREIGTKAIIADSLYGRTARFIASFRATMPVFALCHRESTMRWLALSYGIKAFYYPNYTPGRSYPLEPLRDMVDKGLLEANDRIAYLGALNGTGATFLEINAISAILDNA